MTCSKVPPICHLKELCPQSTIEAEVINKWYTRDTVPVQTDWTELVVSVAIPAVSYHGGAGGGTPGGDEIFTWLIQSGHCPSVGQI